MPIAFSDEEMRLLLQLSGPIDHSARHQFVAAVAAELEAQGQAGGIGAVHRVARQVQRRFWEPPLVADPGPDQGRFGREA
jgi:hypothetical protein